MRRPGKRVYGLVCLALLIALTILLVSFPKAYAYSDEGYDLTELPNGVAEYFNISVFAAGIMVSFMFMLFPTIMVAFVMKRSANTAIMYAILIVNFVVLGFCVALTWLPYWIFLILCLLIALLFAGQIRDMITGG